MIILKIEIMEISDKERGDASPRHNCNGEILVRYGLTVIFHECKKWWGWYGKQDGLVHIMISPFSLLLKPHYLILPG